MSAALTIRQEEIVVLLAKGLTVRQAARELFIAESTTRTHLKNAQSVVDVHTLAGLVSWYHNRRYNRLRMAVLAAASPGPDRDEHMRTLAKILQEKP